MYSSIKRFLRDKSSSKIEFSCLSHGKMQINKQKGKVGCGDEKCSKSTEGELGFSGVGRRTRRIKVGGGGGVRCCLNDGDIDVEIVKKKKDLFGIKNRREGPASFSSV